MKDYVFLGHSVIPFYVHIVLINLTIGLFPVCSLGIAQLIKVTYVIIFQLIELIFQGMFDLRNRSSLFRS